MYEVGLVTPVASSSLDITFDHLSNAVLSLKSSSLITVIVQSEIVLVTNAFRFLPLKGTLIGSTVEAGRLATYRELENTVLLSSPEPQASSICDGNEGIETSKRLAGALLR